MPPAFLASWGWESFSARRRSRTLSPTLLAPTFFMERHPTRKLETIQVFLCKPICRANTRNIVDVKQEILSPEHMENGDGGAGESGAAVGQPDEDGQGHR